MVRIPTSTSSSDISPWRLLLKPGQRAHPKLRTDGPPGFAGQPRPPRSPEVTDGPTGPGDEAGPRPTGSWAGPGAEVGPSLPEEWRLTGARSRAQGSSGVRLLG